MLSLAHASFRAKHATEGIGHDHVLKVAFRFQLILLDLRTSQP